MKLKSNIFGTTAAELLSNGHSDTLLAEDSVINTTRTTKILVADDDPAIIDVFTLMLEAAGYEVYASANWQTIEDVNTICPDLILLDILMSGINGFDICRQLKDQPSTKHIPIIMISANKDIGDISSNACADDFIAKPFEMDKLLQIVLKYT